METRCRRACIAWVIVFSLVGALFLQPGPASARTRAMPKISLSAYQCPAGMDAATASAVDCEPVGDGFDIEIISIENTQPNITLADAQRDGNVYRWEVEPSDAEIDNWGIRQSMLPPGATAYLVQGETVTAKATALYDYRFTTSEADPQTDLAMFVLFSAADGVIIPPSVETSSTNGQPDTNEPGAASTGAETTSAEPTQTAAVANPHARTTGASEDIRTIERETTPMRLAADPRALIVEVLVQGTAVGVLSGPVQAGNGSWYEVESPSKSIGWVESGAFEAPPAVSPAAATSAPSSGETSPEESSEPPPDAVTASAIFAPGDRAVVHDPPLQLRVAANLEAEVIDSLPEGQLLRIDGETTAADGHDWYPVTLLPGATVSGFVAAGFMEAVGLLTGDLMRVASESANVRTEPSTNAEILVNIPQGSAGTVVSGPRQGDGHEWYEIELESGQTGWVADSLLALASTGAIDTAGATQTGVEAGTFRPGAWVTVVDPPINLRVQPGVDAEAIEALDEGDVLIVLSGPDAVDDYEWYRVEVNGLEGYVAGEFLGGGFLPGEDVRVFDGPVYIRTTPSIGENIVIALEQDQVVTVMSPEPLMGDDFLWIEVRTADGSTGFVATEFIEPVGGG